MDGWPVRCGSESIEILIDRPVEWVYGGRIEGGRGAQEAELGRDALTLLCRPAPLARLKGRGQVPQANN